MEAGRLRVLASLAEVPARQWNALAGPQPLLRHEYLSALESTGCVGPDTGWTPRHLTLWQGRELAAAMPLYEKSHSYGEYVFDWAWADAYQRHGLAYYPKLLAAVPFTPIQGPRLLGIDEGARRALLRRALTHARNGRASSFHILFPSEEEAGWMAEEGLLLREGVQFHWRNAGYADFEAFLASLNRDKRKKIRQERRRVEEAGVRFRRLQGQEIEGEHWAFFHRCYTHTYRMHRSTPYLNLAFFERLGAALPEHVLLLIAERDGRPVACALDLFDGEALYGRYWGALEFISGLHFEACYYQAIEFCIERGIARFEGGAQGEHKLARGLLPARTRSAHWLRDPRFADAVAEFLRRETAGIELYIDELEESSPMRCPDAQRSL